MNTSSILDLLLKSGQGTGHEISGQSKNVNSPLGGLGDLLSGSGLGGVLSGFGGGVATGGALGLLLGNKKARKVGGKVAMYGGLAALGVIAYKAYNNWQAQKAQTAYAEPQTYALTEQRLIVGRPDKEDVPNESRLNKGAAMTDQPPPCCS